MNHKLLIQDFILVNFSRREPPVNSWKNSRAFLLIVIDACDVVIIMISNLFCILLAVDLLELNDDIGPSQLHWHHELIHLP